MTSSRLIVNNDVIVQYLGAFSPRYVLRLRNCCSQNLRWYFLRTMVGHLSLYASGKFSKAVVRMLRLHWHIFTAHFLRRYDTLFSFACVNARHIFFARVYTNAFSEWKKLACQLFGTQVATRKMRQKSVREHRQIRSGAGGGRNRVKKYWETPNLISDQNSDRSNWVKYDTILVGR